MTEVALVQLPEVVSPPTQVFHAVRCELVFAPVAPSRVVNPAAKVGGVVEPSRCAVTSITSPALTPDTVTLEDWALNPVQVTATHDTPPARLPMRVPLGWRVRRLAIVPPPPAVSGKAAASPMMDEFPPVTATMTD